MKKFLVFMLVVCSIGGMYYFSSQDAQVSGSQSQLVVRFIDKIRDKVTLQDEKLIKIQTKIYEKLKGFGSKSYIVRKMAHFSIYALIGISLLLFIYLFTISIDEFKLNISTKNNTKSFVLFIFL